jgi:hypothetical protein
MSVHIPFAGTGDLVPGVAIAGFNLIVALALVTVGLLLAIAVSSVAWFHDRPKARQPIPSRAARKRR